MLFDRDGVERWRVPIEHVRRVVFRGDVLHVASSSGLVSIDVTTGTRVAAVCGWGFGAYDESVLAAAPNVSSVCH